MDNIIFSKVWQDNDLIELKAIISSSVVTVTSRIYVSDYLIDDLVCQVEEFLAGNIEEAVWANEDRGNSTTACVSFRFIKKDKLGHILIEVFAELDDGGEFDKHNCCFFVNTEHGLLLKFCEELVELKSSSIKREVQLNFS